VSLPDDRIYLFDTSIWLRTKHSLIAPDWEAAMRNSQLAVSPIVAFEVFYDARNQADFEELERQLDALRQVPLTQGIVRDARRALHDLSAKASHRLPFQDALIAASAAHKNMTVLHYDGHFDVLSEVLGFEGRCARFAVGPAAVVCGAGRPAPIASGSPNDLRGCDPKYR
jgi:predicted nucleic acid-binding protein